MDQFRNMYRNNKFFDVILVVGPYKIDAHKVKPITKIYFNSFKIILSVFSSVLGKLLSANPSENSLTIDTNEPELFKVMINYIYGGKNNYPITRKFNIYYIEEISVTANQLISLLTVADTFGVLPLKEYCGKILGANVSEENFTILLSLSRKYNSNHLRAACASYMATTFDKSLASGEFYTYEVNFNIIIIFQSKQINLSHVNIDFRNDKKEPEVMINLIIFID